VFPKVPDQHKPNKPLVSNGLGIIYIIASTVYLFVLYYFQPPNDASSALTLAACILFGGFMGLLDDWMDLRWRYKAFFPLIAAIPLITLASRLGPTRLGLRTDMTIPILGTINFGIFYYIIIIPLIVTIVTNTVNQLGGLNGLETICPGIVIVGLMFTSILVSESNAILLYVPLIFWFLLAFFNFRGKIFVGNTGSFAIGITLASFAIISDLKTALVISILPFVFNSLLILLNYFFFRTKAAVSFDGKKLRSNHRRSLITLITYHHPLTERQVVIIISILVAVLTSAGLLIQWLLL
jgi:UDP-N-acetylglucosamine--dolichyl-phosphate N-acetylglucosaminephosphotransferase